MTNQPAAIGRGATTYQPSLRVLAIAWADKHWNWRISARLRMIWLASAWGLAAMLAAPFAVVAILGVIRFAGSVVQLWLNRRLGRVHTIEGSDRLDWGLFLLTYLGSISAAVTIESFSPATQLIALSPVLVPVTVLQMRMRARSLRAYRAATSMPC